jgi:tRNA(Ile2) C34 agmatinyltransferase TiaS
MAKSKSRKNQKEKSQKRTQSIRKESVKRLENFQTNMSTLDQVLREYMEEKSSKEQKED